MWHNGVRYDGSRQVNNSYSVIKIGACIHTHITEEQKLGRIDEGYMNETCLGSIKTRFGEAGVPHCWVNT